MELGLSTPPKTKKQRNGTGLDGANPRKTRQAPSPVYRPERFQVLAYLRIVALIFAAGCTWLGDARAGYDYWAWHPKVHPGRVSDEAGTLYLLQGELLMRGGNALFQRRGFPPPTDSAHPLVLVYRLETMDWPTSLQRQVERDLQAFEAKRNSVWGIQIDFDARTRHLDRYGELLRRIRAALPTRYRLSVTGLMDWASQGKLEDLNALEGVVDEIVFQAYQGRRPIKEYRRYFERLSARTLSVAFKLGLVEHGDYDRDALAAVRRHPAYQGTVIFLLPDESR